MYTVQSPFRLIYMVIVIFIVIGYLYCYRVICNVQDNYCYRLFFIVTGLFLLLEPKHFFYCYKLAFLCVLLIYIVSMYCIELLDAKFPSRSKKYLSIHPSTCMYTYLYMQVNNYNLYITLDLFILLCLSAYACPPEWTMKKTTNQVQCFYFTILKYWLLV